MNNKMTKYKESFFKKFFRYIKNVFNKKKILKKEECQEIRVFLENNNDESTISKFSSNSINELVNKYEKGNVKEEDLTEEEIVQLKKYYTEKIQILEKEIRHKKNLIENKKKYFVELYQKSLKLKGKNI